MEGERTEGFPKPLYTRGAASSSAFRILRRPSLSCEFLQLNAQGGAQVYRCAGAGRVGPPAEQAELGWSAK